MSKKRIETYIPQVLDALIDLKIAENGQIPKQFNGYIASFGASIRQAGLLATVLFYKNEQSNAEENRALVVKAIEKIIGSEIIQNNSVQQDIRQKVEDAAVALKLSVRTFKLV